MNENEQTVSTPYTVTFTTPAGSKAREQEVFDKVCQHLRTQKVQACEKDEDEHMVCLYRGPNQTKCAIGALIPDDLIPEINKMDATVWGLPSVVLGFIGADYQLLSDLQRIHDPQEHWDVDGFNTKGEDALKEVAEKHSLSYNAPILPA